MREARMMRRSALWAIQFYSMVFHGGSRNLKREDGLTGAELYLIRFYFKIERILQGYTMIKRVKVQYLFILICKE